MKLKSKKEIQWALILIFIIISFWTSMCLIEVINPGNSNSGISYHGFGIYTYNNLSSPDEYGYYFPKIIKKDVYELKINQFDPKFLKIQKLYVGLISIWYISLSVWLLLLFRFFSNLDPADIFTATSVKGIKALFYYNTYLNLITFSSIFVFTSLTGNILDVYVFSSALSIEVMLLVILFVISGLIFHVLGYFFNNGYRLKLEQELTV